MIELSDGGDELRALEPTRTEVAKAAPRLASFYSEHHNQAMLAHDDASSVRDVVAHYRSLASEGARAFLLELDGELVGDADLRGVDATQAEVAILIGQRAAQGKGLGTRFSVMLHAFAFRALGLRRLYASIIPANAASLRLFAKLGYVRDDSPAARRHADEPADVTLSLTPDVFERLHGAMSSRVRIAIRPRTAHRA